MEIDMTHIEQAIKEAVEKGWERPQKAFAYGADAMEDIWVVEDRDDLFQLEDIYVIQEALLDPAFWQALGKARGWQTSCFHLDESGRYEAYRHTAKCGVSTAKSYWELQWHRFIDHLAEGKDAESFFKGLPTK